MFYTHILGTSAAAPTLSRNLSAQVVSYNERLYLIDCGEGTQLQLMRNRIRTNRLDAIFISHLHGDHVLGLPGLLSTLSLDGRTNPLHLYAPAEVSKVLKLIFSMTGAYLTYDLIFHPLEDFAVGEPIYTTKTLEVVTLPLIHRIFTRGFLFREINKAPKFDFYTAKALEIPSIYFGLLKQGNKVSLEDGRTIQPEQVLLMPDKPKAYAYCSDTQYNLDLLPYIAGADLLYHEATFTHDLADKAAATRHSTARQAATLALQAEVKKLLLGHFSARYRTLDAIEQEAQAVFANAECAVDGRIYQI